MVLAAVPRQQPRSSIRNLIIMDQLSMGRRPARMWSLVVGKGVGLEGQLGYCLINPIDDGQQQTPLGIAFRNLLLCLPGDAYSQAEQAW